MMPPLLAILIVFPIQAVRGANIFHLSNNVASEKGVTNCLNALNAASICSLGPTKQQSCCAAVEKLDYHGCFCDAIFDNLIIYEESVEKLRDELLPICVPEASRFFKISQCPPRTFLSFQENCQDDHLIGRRLASLKLFLPDPNDLLQFTTYDDFVPYFSEIFVEEVEVMVSSVGTYTGFESVVEYLLLRLPHITGGIFQETTASQRFEVFDDGSIGVESFNKLFFQNGTKIRWSNDFTHVKFAPCSHKISGIVVKSDVSFPDLIGSALEEGQPWSVENLLCPIIIKHCSNPLLNVSEFQDEEECVAFQRALPMGQNCDGDESGFLKGNGNSTFCKAKHAFLIPFRPHHHCPHTGRGYLADDHGKFQCTPADCSAPTSVFKEVERKMSIPVDSSKCKLNESSDLLLHLSSLIDSRCSISIQRLDDIFEGIPTNATAEIFQKFCEPNDVCPKLRFNLMMEFSSLLHHCKGAAPESSLPSLNQIMRLASDLSDFQELVCMTRDDSTAENKVCQACTQDDLAFVPSWKGSLTEENNGDGDISMSRICRQTLHFTCSNEQKKVPDFCNTCFMSSEDSGDNFSCSQSVLGFWNYSCAPKSNTTIPRWFDIDKRPFVDPFPGTKPLSDTTEHDLDSQEIFDFIIIGAGNSGCVVARRLSDAGYSVLVLETGIDWQKDRDLWDTRSKRRQVSPLWDTPMTKSFISKPNKDLLNRPLDIKVGSTLGGSTGINAGLYSRPAQEEFDLYWPEKWKGNDVLPYFRKLENYQEVTGASENHGTDGLLTVQRPSHHHTYSSAWLMAAEKAGINVTADGASGGNDESGVYRLSQTWKDGLRQDSFTSYLLPIMTRDTLEVRSGANVVKIIYEDEDGKQRATGVVYVLQGLSRVTVHARREVILSAGWVGSPKILMMSGIGPKNHLEDLNIEVGVPLEGVGQQLVGRPLVNLLFGGQNIAPEEIPGMFASHNVDTEWALNGTGVLDMAIEDIYGKEKSGLDENGKNDFLMSFSNILGSFHPVPLQTMFSICKICRPKSHGSIRLQSPNPFDNPEVTFNMLADERDIDILVACVKKTLSVYKHFRFQGIDLLGVHEMNDEQLRELLQAQVLFSYHAWGSCRMGDGPLDVVEPDGLRIKGFSNLRIIDGSVIPEGPCSGPMATTYMIGERGAVFILDDMSQEHVSGADVVDNGIEFKSIVSVLFFLMLALATGARVLVASRAKTFSKIFKQKMDQRASVTTRFAQSSIPIHNQEQLSSVQDFSIYYSTLTLDQLPGGSRTLFNVTGEIRSSELTFLMGASGSGKSTLLDILSMRFQSERAGGGLLYSFDKNNKKVMASGSNPYLRAFVKRNIAYCEQSPNDEMMKSLTVWESMMYSYMLRVAPGEESRFNNISKVKSIINSIGLAGHENKTTKNLSGGQTRRLQIGTSLIDNPIAIFLDEPTSGLDDNTSLKIICLLKNIAKLRKIPVVAAIHCPGTFALEHASSLYLLYQGYGVFQGKYSDLKEVVSMQDSYELRECPLSYTFDNIGIDECFRKSLLKHHILTFNEQCLPGIQETLQQLNTEGSNPNMVMVENELPMGTVVDSVVTLLSLFLTSLGSERSNLDRVYHFGRIHSSGLTVLALGILLPMLTGKQLPINNMGDIITFYIAWMMFISSALAVFHVSVGLDLIENEAKHFYTLIFEQVIHPKHVTLFWVLQGFLIVLFCLPGYVIFYFLFGFQRQHAVDAILLFFVYCLQAITGVQTIQLCFPGSLAPIAYGIYTALQFLLGGPLPYKYLRDWLEWARYINPMTYYFRTVVSLEMGVGKNVACGEDCRFLLDMYEYEGVDLLWSGIVLFGLYVLQVCVIYIKLSMQKSRMDSSGEMVEFNDEMFMKQNSEDFRSIIASEFEKINTRKLFDRVKSIYISSDKTSPDSSKNDSWHDDRK